MNYFNYFQIFSASFSPLNMVYPTESSIHIEKNVYYIII